MASETKMQPERCPLSGLPIEPNGTEPRVGDVACAGLSFEGLDEETIVQVGLYQGHPAVQTANGRIIQTAMFSDGRWRIMLRGKSNA